jgi:hypothetical protein
MAGTAPKEAEMIAIEAVPRSHAAALNPDV